MDDGGFRPLAKTMGSLSTTCVEMLSWMIEIWMKIGKCQYLQQRKSIISKNI